MKTKPDVNPVPVYFAADLEVDYSTGVSSIYNRITATVWNMDDLRNNKKNIRVSSVAGNVTTFNITNRREYFTFVDRTLFIKPLSKPSSNPMIPQRLSTLNL